MVISTPTVAVVFVPPPVIKVSSLPSTNPYTKHPNPVRHHVTRHAVKEPIMAVITPMSATAATPVSIPVSLSADNKMTQKKSSSHWPLIVAGIALVAALGFYFWTKKAPPRNDFPLPPMGGLSPVGGFTAMRNKVQPEIKNQSIWTKKIL